ncbi:hypothetical protein [Methanoregula sp.]|uniref:hypothetical protein n=1 Tax=Methanoregula sp. TaxID=2052170 RepID=UPI003568BA24
MTGTGWRSEPEHDRPVYLARKFFGNAGAVAVDKPAGTEALPAAKPEMTIVGTTGRLNKINRHHIDHECVD